MDTISEKMTAIADAIRSKTGETNLLGVNDMVFSVNSIVRGANPPNNSITKSCTVQNGPVTKGQFVTVTTTNGTTYVRPADEDSVNMGIAKADGENNSVIQVYILPEKYTLTVHFSNYNDSSNPVEDYVTHSTVTGFSSAGYNGSGNSSEVSGPVNENGSVMVTVNLDGMGTVGTTTNCTVIDRGTNANGYNQYIIHSFTGDAYVQLYVDA